MKNLRSMSVCSMFLVGSLAACGGAPDALSEATSPTDIGEATAQSAQAQTAVGSNVTVLTSSPWLGQIAAADVEQAIRTRIFDYHVQAAFAPTRLNLVDFRIVLTPSGLEVVTLAGKVGRDPQERAAHETFAPAVWHGRVRSHFEVSVQGDKLRARLVGRDVTTDFGTLLPTTRNYALRVADAISQPVDEALQSLSGEGLSVELGKLAPDAFGPGTGVAVTLAPEGIRLAPSTN